MEININQREFSQLLQVIQKGVPTRTAKPILQQIFLEAKEDRLTATAHDTNFGITASVTCEVIEEGAVLVDSLIIAMSKRMSGIVTLKDTMQQVTVRDGRNEATFSALDYRLYPPFPKTGEVLFKISGNELIDYVQKTVYATAKDGARPVLSNLHIVRSGDELRFEATDSHRMAIAVAHTGETAGKPTEMLINGQHLKVFANLFTRSEKFETDSPFAEADGYAVEKRSETEIGEVVLEGAGAHLIIRTVKFSCFASLQEGAYPDLARVIPQSLRRVGVSNRSELLNATEGAMFFAKEFVNLDADLSIAEKGIVLEAGRDGVRKFRVAIPLADGEVKADLRYNARFLRDMMAALDLTRDEVVLQERNGRLVVGDQTSVHVIVNIKKEA